MWMVGLTPSGRQAICSLSGDVALIVERHGHPLAALRPEQIRSTPRFWRAVHGIRCGQTFWCYPLSMNDVDFIVFAETVVDYIDEKYGRAAAWLALVITLLIFVALITALIWWIVS
jgi:hypothetical protein